MNKDSFRDYYKILQVDRNAEQDAITMAYKSLAKKYHPDLNLNNLDEANEKMKAINEAYRILNDAERRRKYNLNYDSYIKDNVNKSATNNSSINNDYDSYVTKKESREDIHKTKKENSEDIHKASFKIKSLLKFRKRTIAIASIIAILLIYVIAEKIIISNDYALINKIEMELANMRQISRIGADLNSNHLNDLHNFSGKPGRKEGSNHDMSVNDIAGQDEQYTQKVEQLDYLREEVQAPSALIHRLFN